LAAFCRRARLDTDHERQAHPVQELEKAAVLQHRVREFYFSSGNYSRTEMAEMLVSALRDMIRICRRYDPPFIASITKSGGVNLRLQ
jgi:hypothetical protein